VAAAEAVVAAFMFSQCKVFWEASNRLEVQDVKGLNLVGALFPPSVAPMSREVLESQSSCYLFPYPSCHLGSSLIILYTCKMFTYESVHPFSKHLNLTVDVSAIFAIY
jgi:hypothetical protein